MAKRQPKSKKQNIRESKKEDEDEGKKANCESEDEDTDGGGADGDHADKNQDVALIKKMIDEYIGDGGKKMSKEEMEGLKQLASEAYQGHKEMGKEEEDAYKQAGEAIKLAAHMHSKRKESESEDASESEDEDNMSPPPPKKKGKPAPKDDGDHGDDTDDDDGDSSEDEGESEEESEDESESEDEGKKESVRSSVLKKRLMKAEGRIAFLESRIKKQELDEYVDAQLKKSGFSRAITQKFREAASSIKSKSDFDSKFKLFREAAGGALKDQDDDWGVMMERSTTNEDGERTSSDGKSTDFSDCAD